MAQTETREDMVPRANSLFERLSETWEGRAQVRSFRWDTVPPWDDTKDDFLAEILPFSDHPAFVAAPNADRARCLGAAWLAWNENQIGFELSIVIPTCIRLMQGYIPGARDPAIWATVSEALTDEAYHIVLTQQGSVACREKRGLQDLKIPRSAVVLACERRMAELAEEWQRDLCLLATTVVTEIVIHAHLRLLSYPPESMQPMHALVNRAHYLDELAHAGMFRAVLKASYLAMNPDQREFFASILPEAVRWFTDWGFEQWESIFEQIQFPGRHEILAQSAANFMRFRRVREALARRRDVALQLAPVVDYSHLIKLCEELGMESIRERLTAASTA